MNDVQIRPYTSSDFEVISKHLFDFQTLIGSLAGSFGKRPFESTADSDAYLEQALKDVEEMSGFFLVAEVESAVVGFIYGVIVTNEGNVFHNLTHIPETEGWIGIIYVSNEYRQHGVGSLLLKKARECLSSAGANTMRLIVDSSNFKAVEYYQKLGFVEYEKKMLLRI